MQTDLEEFTVDRNILNITSTQLRQDLLLKKDAGATHHNNNKNNNNNGKWRIELIGVSTECHSWPDGTTSPYF